MQTLQSEVNFSAPEFAYVFKRILGKKSKAGYYQLRMLNKSFQSEFEGTIETANVNFPLQLLSLTESIFAEQIKVLNVSIPDDLEILDRLSKVSPIYFRDIQKVNVKFVSGQETKPQTNRTQYMKKMRIAEPLILRGVNVACDSQRLIDIKGKFNLTITDCNFQKIEIWLNHFTNILVKNTTFKYSDDGLYCGQIPNAIKMKNVVFLNCKQCGLYIDECNNINIAGLKAENCDIGVRLNTVRGLNMKDGNVKTCRQGILFERSKNSTLQDFIVSQCKETGILVEYSNVGYSRVHVEKKGNASKEISVINGVFTEIL